MMYVFLQIQLFSGANVLFINNSAKTGGAISVFTPIIHKDVGVSSHFNALCFIQYQVLTSDRVAPEEWKVCTCMHAIHYYVNLSYATHRRMHDP